MTRLSQQARITDAVAAEYRDTPFAMAALWVSEADALCRRHDRYVADIDAAIERVERAIDGGRG